MLQVARRCLDIVTSLPQLVRDNRWVLLRLTLATGIGILLLLGGAWAVWNTEGDKSVCSLVKLVVNILF